MELIEIEIDIVKGEYIEDMEGFIYYINPNAILKCRGKSGWSGGEDEAEAIQDYSDRINENELEIEKVIMNFTFDRLYFIFKGESELQIEVYYKILEQYKRKNEAYVREKTINKVLDD